MRRNHQVGGLQDMVVERFELRVMPQAAGIAAGHAHHMRRAGHPGGQIAGNTIGLQVVGKNHIEAARLVSVGGERREL